MGIAPIRLIFTVDVDGDDIECEGPENDGTGHVIPCHRQATKILVYLPSPMHPLIVMCDEHVSRVNILANAVRDDSLLAAHLADVYLWRRGYGITPHKRKRKNSKN